ncbi:hypothetical protein QL104_05015 [Pseudomonas piscis]|uniref:Uncharacterized protein n=1 Tax=Pseudomonas piscis TaxID=2614538 RepID=A0ABY9NJM9_9PSED|nr:hypothetical protein [Pseudomonas piscis]WMN18770.1 hypothetical protein QL104_05015 [Pseudomonas piscis]
MEAALTPQSKPTLNTPNFGLLMQYKNEDVIHKFREEWKVSEDEAKDIFDETKKFLFLASVTTQKCFNLDINEPLLIIDKMWHTFILFTEDYADFCNTHFGTMLHHQPFSKNHLKKLIKKLSEHGMTLSEAKSKHLYQQLGFIEETLGRQTIVKWYVEYSEKYSPGKLSSLQKPLFDGEARLTEHNNIEQASHSASSDLIKMIVSAYTTSQYCGTNCGAYCSCNSGSLHM